MRFAVLLLILALLCTSEAGSCLGSPPTLYGGRDLNCYAVCCAEGFVMDLAQAGQTKCVSCDSVGLIGCNVCSLITLDDGQNITYKCISSKNINNLVTVGVASKCSDNSGSNLGTYILNNFTNFNQCSLCTSIIPNARDCVVDYTCSRTINGKTGNNCFPVVRADFCVEGFGGLTAEMTNCENCSIMWDGCQKCFHGLACYQCDSSRNLTTRDDGHGCQCAIGKTCTVCGFFEFVNTTSGHCQCREGYTNVSGSCTKAPLCGANESYNRMNSSCQCSVGFVRAGNSSCVPLVCTEPNTQVSNTGICVCKHGYIDLINVGCYLFGSFIARTPTYARELVPPLNLSSFYNVTNYKCGCPTNYSRRGDACVHCTALNISCQCNPGYFWNTTRQACDSCDSIGAANCIECIVSYNTFGQVLGGCTRCAVGFNLVRSYNISFGSCLECTYMGYGKCSMCPQSIYQLDAVGKKCEVCEKGADFIRYTTTSCATCSQFIPYCLSCYFNTSSDGSMNNTVKCTKCDTPYLVKNNTCQCPGTVNNGSCIPCQLGCMECLGSTCITCLPQFIKDPITNNSCVCPNDKLWDYCEGCKLSLGSSSMLLGCTRCLSLTSCDSCAVGYVYTTGGHCELCSRYLPGCLQCTNATYCTSCDIVQGYELSLVMHSCVCIENSIKIGQLCSPCDRFMEHCSSCFTTTVCDSCAGNYSLNYKRQCVCTGGYVEIQAKCRLCSETFANCFTCNETKCYECKSGWRLNVTDNKCYPNPCSGGGPGCIQCYTPSYCSVCEAVGVSYGVPVNGVCDCQKGYYLNFTSDKCMKCPITCTKCSMLFKDNPLPFCQQCIDGLHYRSQGVCACLNYQYPIYENGTIVSCASCKRNCGKCVNKQACTACAYEEQRDLINGVCVCKPGMHSEFTGQNPLDDFTRCVPDA